MEAALPATNSASMPKRCLILLSTSFLSSALLGTETTTFPSRLALSTILFHSLCAGCPVCACATSLPNREPAMKTRRNNNFMRRPRSSLLAQKFPCHGSTRLSHLINLVFRLVFQFVKLFQSQRNILRRDDAKLSEPLRVDIQTSGTDTHSPRKDLLPVSTQQPVDEDLRRVGMRLILENRDMTVAATNVETLLRYRQRRDRKIGFNEREELRIADAGCNRDLAFGQIFGEQTQIPSNEQFLRHQPL